MEPSLAIDSGDSVLLSGVASGAAFSALEVTSLSQAPAKLILCIEF